jgi:hypothetical protein
MSITMKQAEDAILYAPQQDCVEILSSPGEGKSAIHKAISNRGGYVDKILHSQTLEVVEVGGLPYIEEADTEKVVRWAAPMLLPLQMLSERAEFKGKRFFVNLDDWAQASPGVKRALVRAIYADGRQRLLGHFPVLQSTRFMATGNRLQDNAGVTRDDSYVVNRITYIEVKADPDEWCSGAISGFTVPVADPAYPDKRKEIDAAVALGVPDELIAFVKWGKVVSDFAPEAKAFMSPRSLERLGRFMRAYEAAGINGEVLAEVANGTIGEAQAVKLLAFCKLRDKLPDTEALLSGKDVKLPAQTDILWIAAATVLRAAKKEHVPVVAKLIDKIAGLKHDGMLVGVEVSAYMVHECLHGSAQNLRGFRESKEFFEWLAKNGQFYRS